MLFQGPLEDKLGDPRFLGSVLDETGCKQAEPFVTISRDSGSDPEVGINWGSIDTPRPCTGASNNFQQPGVPSWESLE